MIPNDLPSPPLVRPGLLMARLSNVNVMRLDASISPEDYQMHVEQIEQELRTRQETQRYGTLYDIPEPVPITAQQRKQLANMLNGYVQKIAKTTMAFALSTTSSIVRGNLQAVFWQAPPPYPYSIVESSSAGFAFLAQHMTGLDAADLEHRYQQLRKRMQSTVRPSKPGALRG